MGVLCHVRWAGDRSDCSEDAGRTLEHLQRATRASEHDAMQGLGGLASPGAVVRTASMARNAPLSNPIAEVASERVPNSHWERSGARANRTCAVHGREGHRPHRKSPPSRGKDTVSPAATEHLQGCVQAAPLSLLACPCSGPHARTHARTLFLMSTRKPTSFTYSARASPQQ